MKSAELKVLSAELKDRPQFIVAFTACESASFLFFLLSTQREVACGENLRARVPRVEQSSEGSPR